MNLATLIAMATDDFARNGNCEVNVDGAPVLDIGIDEDGEFTIRRDRGAVE
jgi:hypothetical protein